MAYSAKDNHVSLKRKSRLQGKRKKAMQNNSNQMFFSSLKKNGKPKN